MKQSRKLFVKERAKYCCEYCIAQVLFSADTFSTEHIIPVVKDGTDDVDNLAFSCQYCNNLKYKATQAIDPATGNMADLYNPRKDIWAEHFEWYENFTIIRGISATGRATEVRLKLNRIGLLNLRKVLVQTGFHPPY
jgi:5-methylcytosine-specific restriction endonuclease McrA